MASEETLPEMREREVALVADLDELAREFATVMGARLAADLPNMARKLGLPQHQATLALGPSGMEALRAKVQALQDGMPAMCADALLVPTVWGHLYPAGGYRPAEDGRGEEALPALLTQDLEEAYPREPGLRQRYAWALADCLTPFVTLLSDAGFATTRARGEAEPVAPAHELIYGQVAWPERALALHGEYRERILTLRELAQKILDLEEVQSTEQLDKLWKQFE